MTHPIFNTTNGLSEKKLQEDYPEYYKELILFVKENDISLSEKIWLFQHKLCEKPKCLNCDKKVNFIKFYKGYRKYCSRKCAAEKSHQNQDIKHSRIKNMLSCNYDDKMREQMTLKANITKSKFSKQVLDSINNKRKQTVLEKYGVDNVSKSHSVNEQKSFKIKEVLSKNRLKKTIDSIEKLNFKINNINQEKFDLYCNKCLQSFIITRTLFHQRKRTNVEICLNCNPNNNDSFFEKNTSDFIKDNYSGEVSIKFKEICEVKSINMSKLIESMMKEFIIKNS